ncbi:TPA: hypothetical protein ACFP4Y_002267 [Neisseria bacilliformis]|uniref:hypothetical protein n=1 Tax=Neisseria bacilliformis TaxID=267212 RepID=UPI0006696E36|nr:hypothetical protein [Neisseria bacilliformis]
MRAAACLLLLYTAAASAAGTQPCPDGLPRADAARCAKAQMSRSKRNLLAAEKELADKLAAWGADEQSAHAAGQYMIYARHTFKQYRAAQCQLAATLSGAPAAAQNIRRNTCKAELNNRRAEQIRVLADNLPQRLSENQTAAQPDTAAEEPPARQP